MRVDRTQPNIVTLIPETAQDILDLVEARQTSPKKLADKYEIKVREILSLRFIKGIVSFKRESEFNFERLPS